MGRLRATDHRKRALSTDSGITIDTKLSSQRKRKGKKSIKKSPAEDTSTASAPLISDFRGSRIRGNNINEVPRDFHECHSNGPSPKFEGLKWPSNGTRSRIDEGPVQLEERLERMRTAVRTLLECIGEDPDREGLLATPSRYAKALLFLTKGYQDNLQDVINNAIFYEGHAEMIIVKNIEINSLCEHHLVPFTGKVCHIAINKRLLSETHPSIDAHRLHTVQRCHRSLQAPTHRGDVLPATANTGAPN